MSTQFSLLRITELRRLLDDEEKCNRIIRYSEKFQRLKRITEGIVLSNRRLAEGSLIHKPAFRDAKVLLAMKYKELEKLMGNITVKQSHLDERCRGVLHVAQLSLAKKTSSAEQSSEVLFQMFVEGETPVGDFVEGFQHLRKLYHVRLVLVNVIQDMNLTKRTNPGRPADVPAGDHPPAERPSRARSGRLRGPAPVCVLPAIGRSLASLPAVQPPSGARGRRDTPPLQQAGSHWVHHHHHHHYHQHQHHPRCPGRVRKPARLQKLSTRRGPGPD